MFHRVLIIPRICYRVLNMPGLQKVLKKMPHVTGAVKMVDRIPNIPQVLNMPRF